MSAFFSSTYNNSLKWYIHGPLTCMLLSIPGVTQDPTKQLAPIGSAALTIIEYKQTDKQSI